MVAILKQEVELAEDAGKVAAVDLVDDENVGRVLLPLLHGGARDLAQGAVFQLKPDGVVLPRGRAVALEEVLVGRGWVKLHDSDVVAGDVLRELLRDVRLTRAWWPVEDQLRPIAQ